MNNKDIINPVDINNPSNTRRTSDLLPSYHRTDKNIKFLSSTLDQFIQQPQLERINGFVGSKLSLNYDPAKDVYIDGGSPLRTNYQLEPSMVIRDYNNVVYHASTYDDLINQLQASGANVTNLDRLFRPKSFSYDPCIDWDKFVNFREYYWLPTGPDAIEISGIQHAITKTFSVSDAEDGYGLMFTPYGSEITETNPLLTLYRGSTYTFNVDSKYPVYIKTAYVRGNQSLYDNVIGQGTNQLTVVIDDFTPDVLFYFAEGNDYAIGTIDVKQLTENTSLNVEDEIIGKKFYTSTSGVIFSNGMKIRLVGEVYPETYKDRDFIIEGVGTSITLVDYDSLQTVGTTTTNLNVNFDATPFDQYPFDDFQFVPLTPEYVTINRASPDLNSWSRYNRWFHADVIKATAEANGVVPEYPVEMRASRPIIEFIAGLQLFNFGARAKKNIDLIDNTTKNAFATFERSAGFFIDGVQVEHGFRVIFNADTDPLVRGRIYTVKFVTINDKVTIDLELAEDSEPLVNDAVVTVRGNTNAGCNWWYDGNQWVFGQQKNTINQFPLFDLFDESGNRFADQSIYNSSFKGTEIFSYGVGSGPVDPVLGFPLRYKNVTNVGDYLFVNNFTSDTFTNFVNNQLTVLTVAGNYLKVNLPNGSIFRDVWVEKIDQEVPIIQFQTIDFDTIYVEITAVENSGYLNDLNVAVMVNDVKQIHNVDYIIQRDNGKAFIVSNTGFKTNDRVLIKLFTSAPATESGYYEVPANLTNNPLNGPISEFTFTEISDHVKTIVENNNGFVGTFPGTGNLRDLPNVSAYGTRMLGHMNPISFSHLFLGTKEHNLISAIRQVGFDYNQFKFNLVRAAGQVTGATNPGEILDLALSVLNSNKDSSVSYNYADMLAYGKDHKDRVYTVTHPRNNQYSLETVFDSTVLSERAVLVYLNDRLLLKDRDYQIDQYNARVIISTPLAKNDVIRIADYPSTVGSFVPPTPTKLGLYPKYEPKIFYDDTYAGEPVKVIQGHDGSITVAYNDFRDDVLLEFEYRVYNNIKLAYDSNLLDINAVIPGAFRNTEYSLSEINNTLIPDFLRWTGYFSVDFQTNNTFDETNPFTYNYSSDVDVLEKRKMPGNWRAIYKYFYDTDRPHTHPWEMLGFSEQPSWWESEYGAAPYTSGNNILWKDPEEGRILQGERSGTDPLYARPGLLDIIPVNDMGELLAPSDIGLISTPIYDPNDPTRVVNLRSTVISSRWQFGDQGPAETAWRRSSNWPFACQVLMALSKPATYASVMFDPARLKKNAVGQYRYEPTGKFITLTDVVLHRDVIDGVRQLASGYSVFVIETGLSKDPSYLVNLKQDLSRIDFNIMAKLGGFVSKDKLQVTIDAVDPNSPYPGVLLPVEDYQIFYNQSTPVVSLGISGIIVQKTERGYTVRGYDKFEPYFRIYKPFPSNFDTEDRVGGRSEKYTEWTTNKSYDIGQIVFYNDRYYRVKQKHNSGETFVSNYYQSLPKLPQVGGAAALRRTSFDTEESIVVYGTEYKTIQEVYDLIQGYGKWLVAQGFVFNDFIDDLGQVSDWNFTAKEFLYWTTQNWAPNSVITLSPFANSIEFTSNIGVVDNLVNTFDEYSLLSASGKPFPMNNFTITRLDGTFNLSVRNTTEGLFFARLNVIQKEHSIIFNNYTLFNDVVYDIGTGYRQRRVNLKGFRTADWNGDFFSPGFVFDQVNVTDWEKYVDYTNSQVVRFSGKYYAAKKALPGTDEFNFSDWELLGERPYSKLYPNFDYKINQFEDFYSLDIDNFDASQQAMAQHLVGYTPRPYLNNIIGDSIAQYKFYQGYIKEKGTKNPLIKLSKASLNNWQSSIDFNEEWAFRVGYYGGFNTYQELETQLESTKFLENPQIVKFAREIPQGTTDAVYYKDASSLIISPEDRAVDNLFPTIASSSTVDDFQLPVAGYVRFDDIFATAYNKNSILDIANNNQILEGSVIWLGFAENGDWDVLRYSKVPVIITNAEILVPGQSMQFTTTQPHGLAVGDLVSVGRIAEGVDQCYQVTEITGPETFVVFTTLGALPPMPDTITGLLFAFKSSRIPVIEDLYKIPYLEKFKFGDLLWVDTDENSNWTVYQKIDNYWSSVYANGINKPGQQFGSNIIVDGNTVIAASPNYFDSITQFLGRVFVLERTETTSTPYFQVSYSLNDGDNLYYTGAGNNGLGSSLAFDSKANVVIAGAPYTSNVREANSDTVVNPLAASLNYLQQGAVKISLIDRSGFDELDRVVVTTPNPADSALFGMSVAYSTTTNKLLIGSPGYNSNIGAVYQYQVNASTSSVTATIVSTISENVYAGSKFGSAITGNHDLSRYAVSAPGYYPNAYGSLGAVFVYDSNLTNPQIITGDDSAYPVYFSSSETFGTTVQMTDDGQYLIIGSPYATDPERNTRSGVVDIFTWNPTNTRFEWSQRIHAPSDQADVNFGFDISVSKSGRQLAISLTGAAQPQPVSFDTYTDPLAGTAYVNDPNSTKRAKSTSFDSGTTNFNHRVSDAGSVHVYYRIGNSTKYTYSQELTSRNIQSTSTFGYSLAASDTGIYVGAPALLDNSKNGQVFIFDKKNTNVDGWQELRKETPLVDLRFIKNAKTINTTDEQIQDYLDVIDPIKGNILETARQELKFITSYDPAIYSLGISGVNTDPTTNWLETHVGQLWWDLSSIKFVWYEQGELEYRKNNWNTIFPGCSVDVYEWVETKYLPSEWAVLADTTEGLAQGVSGQPKFADNTVMSVKQVYNAVSNSFTNMYYYWVKNKNTVPANVPNRRISAFEVANQIVDPVGTGSKFIAFLGPDSLMLANAKSSVQNEQTNLNVVMNSITDSANRHTEWLLLQENDPNSKPNWLLEKKLFDSLLGHDSLGNPVPDETLPAKLRYGVEIRPRQGLFVNRMEALRNVLEFTNEVLASKMITGQVSFVNLETKDQIPEQSTYDQSVEDIFALELIPTTLLSQAELKAIVDSNGKITSVQIVDRGYGYKVPPIIEVTGSGTGAKVSVTLNDRGQITTARVDESGSGYSQDDVKLSLRPFTVVVQTDSSVNGKWAIYEWDQIYKEWKRIRTQEFDTTNYWNYIDWVAPTYDAFKEISVTVTSPYELNELQLISTGAYVKVLNGGDGRFMVLERTENLGTYSYGWDIVYSEKGTIQFSETLWNPQSEYYSWDSYAGFDQTEFDQAADQELFYILTAIKDDLFVDSMKIYWNQLFFKAVRYAFSEQKNLDWAFKTAFISVINTLGSLDQKHTYKLQNSVNYENFLEEIKPYHTKIRRFTEAYTSTELTQSYTTDFDLPAYYNTVTSNFEVVNLGNNLLLEYPWKSWYDNYTYGIESIYLYDGGANYTEVPAVEIVTAPGDTGYGATAVAYLSLGKVVSVVVTNPGRGYTQPPLVVFNGGGGGLASTSTTTNDRRLKVAKAYVRLGNSPVRSNKVTIKFDRVSTQREIGDQFYTDTFVGDGERTQYRLTWVPVDDKAQITLTVNGVLQLIDSYRIEYSEAPYNPEVNTGYKKKYATLVLAFTPNNLDVVELIYPKDLGLYNALDRISDYYEPTAGMPGKDPAQLMSGMEYSGLQIDTLPFDAAGGWDVVPFGVSSWDNYSLEEGYTSFSTNSTSTQTFVLTDMIISTGTQVNVYINGKRRDSTSTNATIPTLFGLGTGAVEDVTILSPGKGYTPGQVSVVISAPNSLTGVQAFASVTVDPVTGSITAITVPEDKKGSGYTEPPVVTIIGACTVQAYASAVLKSEFIIASTSTVQTDVVIPASEFTTSTSLIEFRYSTSDGTLQFSDLDSLDAVINGGDLAYTTALGVKPSEIILDGGSTSTRHITGMLDDGFLNPIDSYAPEECVPGQVREAFGITVYSQPYYGTPVIVNKKYRIDGVPNATYDLGITPSNHDSVIALFNDEKLLPADYNIDFSNNTFSFASDSAISGWLSLTTMQIGTIGLLDSFKTVTTSSVTVYESPVLLSDIGSNGTSSYVTINGTPAILGVDYTITAPSTATNRAVLTFNQSGTIQSYLFSGPIKSFSEINDQVVIASVGESVFDLTQPPGNIAPFHSQVIVTKNGLRMNPPVTTYYQVIDGQTSFDLTQSIVYPTGSISLAMTEVYINGVRAPVPGVWRIIQSRNQVAFKKGSLSDGDVIAIVVKKDHDYLIEDNQLKMVVPCVENDELRITTFTNHDPDFIRTERFKGNLTDTYRLQRPALNSAYVWVSYNGVPLAPDIDFTVDHNGYLVKINRGPFFGLNTSPADDVVITSFVGLDAKLTAYRMFRDMLGRTHYKRLSDYNSTLLAQNLYSTSTSIVVGDASVLTMPDIDQNRPGVILIAGERIEFFTVNGNELGQLRRGTLGTAPRDEFVAGTVVVDQGSLQTMPVRDFIQSTSTVITTSSQTTFDLSIIQFNTTAEFSDQVEVRYGGRPLLKPGVNTVTHDYTTYDNSTTAEISASEFSINTSSVLTLNFTPEPGVELEVVSRKSLAFNEVTNNFIQERSAALPDKYRYG